MNIQEEIERYFMGVTNLSKNQLRGRLNSVITGNRAIESTDEQPPATFLQPRSTQYQITEQVFPSTAIRQDVPAPAPAPASSVSSGEIDGIYMVRIDPDTMTAVLHADCTLQGTLGPPA